MTTNPDDQTTGDLPATDNPPAEKPSVKKQVTKAVRKKATRKNAKKVAKKVVKKGSDDVIENAAGLKDRGVAIVESEVRGLFNRFASGFVDTANRLFDKLEGKKK
jgi:uncharacterized protein (UPF0254 family)|tara:strand:- start:2105 stop:2419 length:315 start_codon:yes stop_codon:yes gene_type:complete